VLLVLQTYSDISKGCRCVYECKDQGREPTYATVFFTHTLIFCSIYHRDSIQRAVDVFINVKIGEDREEPTCAAGSELDPWTRFELEAN
jgi:hypothetical protein